MKGCLSQGGIKDERGPLALELNSRRKGANVEEITPPPNLYQNFCQTLAVEVRIARFTKQPLVGGLGVWPLLNTALVSVELTNINYLLSTVKFLQDVIKSSNYSMRSIC